jgi:hypothetical protein
VHLKRLGEPRQPTADSSEADDQQRLACELVLALVERSDHPAKHFARLVVARLG